MKTDNELIAEFMGHDTMPYHPKGLLAGEKDIPPYDTSWNYLMPVVEKIEKLEHDPDKKIFYNITARMEWAKVTSIYITTPINIVYESVVSFIKWYNSQKQS